MKNKNNHYMAVSPCGLATTFGIIGAFSMLFMGVATSYGWGNINTISDWYVGFDTTLMGIIIGMIWGFVDGFIGGYLIAWIYNYFAGTCDCKADGKKKKK